MPAPVLPPALAKFWAELTSGTSGTVTAIPSGSAVPNASFDDGFPLINMTPLGAGGVPPAGGDMNGILQLLTKHAQWSNSGGLFPFQAALSSAWGGYPAGHVLVSNDGNSAYISMVNFNTTDFNSTPASIGTLWAPWAGNVAANGHYALDTGAANAYVVALSPPVTANQNGLRVSFKTLNANTTSSTINVGGGVVPLVQNNGAALFGGKLKGGSVYSAVYDSATSSFWLDESFDYEEGNFTPTLTGHVMDSGVYADLTREGAFIRVGNLILFGCSIGTSHGEPPSFHGTYPTVQIGNLPSWPAAPGYVVFTAGMQWSMDQNSGILDTKVFFDQSLMTFVNNHGGALRIMGIRLRSNPGF